MYICLITKIKIHLSSIKFFLIQSFEISMKLKKGYENVFITVMLSAAKARFVYNTQILTFYVIENV